MQEFGGVWTKNKLDVVERYLEAYTTLMKNQNFNLCYIDAFSGSGELKIKTGEELDGSAVRALRYPFDKYIFFEIDSGNFKTLQNLIHASSKKNTVESYNNDCNEFLIEIDKINWGKDNWRGVIFIDPYSMELPWECLEKISNTQTFDVWYLFPLYALSRNLYNNKQIPLSNKIKISKLLGTNSWEAELYRKSDQMTLFEDEMDFQKIAIDGVTQYIVKRLEDTFPTVSRNAAVLKNSKNAPMFLLCFAGSNPNYKAKAISLRIANHILEHI